MNAADPICHSLVQKGVRRYFRTRCKRLCATYRPPGRLKSKSSPRHIQSFSLRPLPNASPGTVTPRCQGCPFTCSVQALPPAPAVPCLSHRALTQNTSSSGLKRSFLASLQGHPSAPVPQHPCRNSWWPQDAMHFSLKLAGHFVLKQALFLNM